MGSAPLLCAVPNKGVFVERKWVKAAGVVLGVREVRGREGAAVSNSTRLELASQRGGWWRGRSSGCDSAARCPSAGSVARGG